MKNTTLMLMLVCSILCGTHVQAADALEQGFKTPPESAKPWVYWMWMNGNLTKEGITADLEAMHRVGISGALIMSVSAFIPPGRVDFMTDEWRGMLQHALREADRLGIKINLNNADGWAGSCGPWNTIEHSMQVLTSSETRIAGPCRYARKLPAPPAKKADAELSTPEANTPYYRDIAVYALRSPDGDTSTMRECKPVVTAGDSKFEGAKVVDGRSGTVSPLPLPEPGKPQYIQLQFAKPFTARACILHTKPGAQAESGELMVSDDGVTYTRAGSLAMAIRTQSDVMAETAFQPVSGKFYRIVFTKVHPKSKLPGMMNVAEIELFHEVRVPDWRDKAGFTYRYSSGSINADWPSTGALRGEDIVDVTKFLSADGTLNWDVPPGNWIILRVGHTTTGRVGHPCTPNGTGLECDKMSKEAMDIHFAGFLGKMIKEAGALTGKTLFATHIDSWEQGVQNWTPKFREEFLARRGYDPLKFLPVEFGYAVDSAEVSERFLLDFRTTCADLIADNYFGYLRTLANKHGMLFSSEAYGGDFDNFRCALQADIPMGEFWVGKNTARTIVAPVSAGHAAGKKIIAAEAFTAGLGDGAVLPWNSGWRDYPFALKALGDRMYAGGINRFILSSSCQEPWTNRLPGMTFGPYGIHFERTSTWFEQSTAWLSYLSRCQYLLQEGLFAADCCVLRSEVGPNFSQVAKNIHFDGYGYDYVSSEILLTMTIHDGLLRLPSGMQYRVLVLSDGDRMTPAATRNIRELVRDGAVVLGPKPVKSPSLQNYPDCDKEVKAIADEVWGDCDGKAKQEHSYGKGRVFWGKPLAAVFSAIRLAPDFESKSAAGETKINWIHRRAGDAEVYFVASETNVQTTVDATFRVTGKIPEFWYPDTGRIETVGVWKTENGRTIVPIKFDPCGSVFVVFRKAGTPGITALTGADSAIRVSPSGAELVACENGRYEVTSAAGAKSVEVTGVPKPLAVTGPWQVSFPPKLGAPPSAVFEKLISWPEHTEEGIKYFSGSATYTKEIDIPVTMVKKDLELSLDLGQVEVIAEVNVNGKDAGILWKLPFRTDITALVKPGKNTLKIRVTNLWINRLIGDEFKPPYLKWETTGKFGFGGPLEWPDWVKDGGPVPDTGRVTFATWQHWTKEDKPVPSGLLGPVTIRAAEVKKIKL